MVSMLIALVASSPASIRATWSLEATREATSPAKRWPKNSIGSATTCQKKRVVVTSDSLVSMRARQTCCIQVSRPCMAAASASPISRPATTSPLLWISTSSTKVLVMVGTASPGSTSIRVASTAKASGVRALPSRLRSPLTMPGCLALRRNSGPGSKPRQMPVKPSSNSSRVSTRGPSAGSLR